MFQHEIAPNPAEGSDGHHIQGYIHFTTPRCAAPVNATLHLNSHTAQTVNGTASDNRAYCTDPEKRKAGTELFSFGDCPVGSGERTDLKRAWDKVCETESLAAALGNAETEIATLKFHKHLAWGLNIKKKARLSTYRRKHWVSVYWGTPGSGKSDMALEFDPDNCFTMPPPANANTLWFGSYSGERTLIIDEFEKHSTSGGVTLSLYWLKRILDNKPLEVPTKGGHVWAEWETVIVTTNYEPSTWFTDADDAWQFTLENGTTWGNDYPSALQRRIDKIYEFKGVWPEVTIEPNKPSTLEERLLGELDFSAVTDIDEEVMSIVEDIERQEEDEANDFMRDIPTEQREGDAESDRIVFGTDGDVEPDEGENLFGFTMNPWAGVA